MTNINDLHILMGRVIEGIENLERGVTGINNRLDNKIQPVLDDYQKTKSKITGACVVISAIAGSGTAWFTGLFKH